MWQHQLWILLPRPRLSTLCSQYRQNQLWLIPIRKVWTKLGFVTFEIFTIWYKINIFLTIRYLNDNLNDSTVTHGLSQQGVWVPFWTSKPLKRTPQDTQNYKCGISKNLHLKLIIEFFHLLIIPMTLFNDTMPFLMNLYMFMVEIWVYCDPL